MMSPEEGEKAVKTLTNRRSAGVLGSQLPSSGAVTYDSMLSAAEQAVKASPTSFNCEDTRMAALIGQDHHRYWRLVMANPRTTEEEKSRIERSLMPAMGTLLFFIDNDVLMSLCQRMPEHSVDFPKYAAQGCAMAALSAWTAISSLDPSLGAIAGNYGYPLTLPESEDMSKHTLHPGFPKEMDVPASWRLQSELVFGSVEKEAPESAEVKDSHRFMVFSDTYGSLPVPAPHFGGSGSPFAA